MLAMVLYKCGECEKVFGVAPGEEDSVTYCPYCGAPAESAEFIDVFTLQQVRWKKIGVRGMS